MKIDVEMITCLTGHFENNEVCDALIKEWETDCTKEEEISIQIFNKKEDFFLNNSEYRNKPKRDENANRKMDNAWFEKRKENKTPNRGNSSRSRGKFETVTTDEIKVIALKGLYFHQEITKTEAQEVKPRLIVKNMIKRKETFFQMVGQLQKNLKPSQSQLMGIIEMLDLQSKNIMRYTLFLRHNSAKTTKVKMYK